MSANELKIPVNVDTGKLSLKLRAIAKHATGLADELEKIDRVVCPECQSLMNVHELHAEGVVIDKSFQCDQCGYAYRESDKDVG